MTKKTVLSADIGTTSLKAALIDAEGNVKVFAKAISLLILLIIQAPKIRKQRSPISYSSK